MSLGNTVFFRADAGVSIGMGHIRRCAVLADEIAKCGAKVILLTRRQPDVAELDLLWPHDLCWMNGGPEVSFAGGLCGDEEESDARQSLEAIQRLSGSRSWIVFDSGRLGYCWERIVRSAGHTVLVIEDSRVRKHCADIVVRDSQAPFDQTLISSNEACLQLHGRLYALVDSRFSPSRERVCSPIRGGKIVLISYGGSDPTDETSKAIEALVSLEASGSGDCQFGRIDIVVGPLNKRARAIVAAARKVRRAVIHHAPPCMAYLMREADICLTAGGNTLIEALTMGKRCLVTMTADNQEATVYELSEEGAVVFLGRHTEVAPEHVAEAITEALSDERKTMVARTGSKAAYDHFGARRIVQEMSGYVHSNLNEDAPIGANRCR